MQRLDCFEAFVAELCPHLVDNERKHGIFAVTRRIAALKVGVAGFNSAWSCSGAADNGHLWLGEWQLDSLAVRQALRIENQLSRSGDLGLTPYFPGVEVNREPLVQAIRSRRQALRQAVDDVTRDLGKVQGTVVAKDEAMKVFDETYRTVVRTLIQAFRMADMTELASRIPISPARRSHKKADIVEQALPAPEPADPPSVAS